MVLICNPAGVVDAKHPGQGLGDITAAGFDQVLLSTEFCCEEKKFKSMSQERRIAEAEHLIYVPDHPEKLSEAMKPFLEMLRQKKMRCDYALASHLPRDRKNFELNKMIVPIVEGAVRLAVQNGCKGIILRPLYTGVAVDEEWEVNKSYLLRLGEVAREELQALETGVGSGSSKATEAAQKHFQILVENQCKYQEGHLVRGILSDSADVREWMTELQSAFASSVDATGAGEQSDEEVQIEYKLCMNVGSLSVYGQDIYEYTMAVADHIGAVIVHDGSNADEVSMVPFTSVSSMGLMTRWIEIIRGLRSISYDGPLILDMEHAAKFCPPLLRPDLMKFAKRTMDYLVWQIHMADAMKKYDHIVLFGAGNMCRNYLTNYGKEYPPLFTCDNNPNRWGEDFYGLRIESPEKLRDLPENTGIFICNVYYREIQKQLEEMGITEGVEFFNDEYLQSLNMERLRGL